MRVASCALLLTAAVTGAAADEGEDGTCSAQGTCGGGSGAYWWPHAKGTPGRYGVTNLTFTKDLAAKLKWRWLHPKGRYGTTLLGGTLIDDEANIYISAMDGIRKFQGADGKELWHYYPQPSDRLAISQVPSLMDGRVYGCSNMPSLVFAVDMKTGKEVWSTKVAHDSGGDTAYVEANDGRVFLAQEHAGFNGAGNKRVFALNATTGDKLWEYVPEVGVWNFMPMFVGDGSFIFMDWAGGVYRLAEKDGKEIWHTRPPAPYQASFTDGGVILGPDGNAYTCANLEHGEHGTKGALRAYRLQDGGMLWDTELHLPCTSWAAISPDNKWGIVPIAPFVNVPMAFHWGESPHWLSTLVHIASLALGKYARYLFRNPKTHETRQEYFAFDVATGKQIWTHKLPSWFRLAAMGDEEGLGQRIENNDRLFCLPAPLTTPTIAGDGTVYVGEVSGRLYGVKHLGDGKVEEHYFDTGGAFLHGGAALAPGMLAITTCDSLHVFME
mmetsp:Transcript_115759/g.160619  ORF Transcript_115759/g.160619 Transcript_115759/m.160619 type:complete len:497 (-) Transcript_115759:115-1605(-)